MFSFFSFKGSLVFYLFWKKKKKTMKSLQTMQLFLF